MQVAAPPDGSALREVIRRIEEGEGHVAEYAAPLVALTKALPAPNPGSRVIRLLALHK